MKLFMYIAVCILLALAGCKSKTEAKEESTKETAEKGDEKRQKKEALQRPKLSKAKKQKIVKKTIKELKTADESRAREALKNGNLRIRLAALGRLKDLKASEKETMESIIPLLAAIKIEVRIAAIDALASAGEPAIEPLIAALRSDSPHAKKTFKVGKTTRRIGFTIMLSLKKIGKPAVEPLIGALDSPDAQQKEFCIRTLGLMGQEAKPATEKLLKLASDKNPSISGAAIISLAKIDPQNPKVVKAVDEGLKSPDQDVVKHAELAKKVLETPAAEPSQPFTRKSL